MAYADYEEDDPYRRDYESVALGSPTLTPVGNGFTPVPQAQQQAYSPAAQNASPSPVGSVAYSGDPQSYVQQLIQTLNLKGTQADPTALNQIVQALKQRGVNASLDVRSDGLHKGIMLDGQFVKLLDGNDNWTWLPGGNASSATSTLTGLLDPYSGVFKAPNAAYESSQILARLPKVPTIDPFTAPTQEEAQSQPGYQFRLDQGKNALEHGQAEKGILRTGGSLKDLLEYGQNFASNEYQNVFNNKKTAYDTNTRNTLDLYDRDLGRSLIGETGANTAYDRSWQQFVQDWNMYRDDQLNRLNLLTGQANNGLTAARA